MRGEPKCPAGPNAIWDGAPEVWKERVRKRGGGQKGKGKGKGKPGQRNLGKRGGPMAGQPLAKTPCPNWTLGTDFASMEIIAVILMMDPKREIRKERMN